MTKIYLLTGSLHSTEVEKILDEKRLNVERVDLSEPSSMASAFRDIGISELPTLIHNGQSYVGLEEIRHFIEESGEELS